MEEQNLYENLPIKQSDSFSENTNKSENSSLKKEFSYSPKNFHLMHDEILFKNENTFENYLYQEKLNEKLRNDEMSFDNKLRKNSLYDDNFDCV